MTHATQSIRHTLFGNIQKHVGLDCGMSWNDADELAGIIVDNLDRDGFVIVNKYQEYADLAADFVEELDKKGITAHVDGEGRVVVGRKAQ